jgi:hypothetical protein
MHQLSTKYKKDRYCWQIGETAGLMPQGVTKGYAIKKNIVPVKFNGLRKQGLVFTVKET